jgi:hypothetical protein
LRFNKHFELLCLYDDTIATTFFKRIQ